MIQSTNLTQGTLFKLLLLPLQAILNPTPTSAPSFYAV